MKSFCVRRLQVTTLAVFILPSKNILFGNETIIVHVSNAVFHVQVVILLLPT